jgi:hypothetical protein
MEQGKGIEPSSSEWKSDIIAIIRPLLIEREKGFEPSTPTLARLCSTPELLPLMGRIRRVLPTESSSLAFARAYRDTSGGSGGIRTPNARRRLIYSQVSSQLLNTPNLATVVGLEPTILGLTGRSYIPLKLHCPYRKIREYLKELFFA